MTSRSELARKIVAITASVAPDHSITDPKALFADWVGKTLNLVEPLIAAAYIVHDQNGKIISVWLVEADAEAACGHGDTVLTWEIQ